MLTSRSSRPLPGDSLLDEEELRGIREVGDEEVDFDAGLGLQTGGQRLQTLPPASDDQHVATVLCEAFRKRRSDT